MSADPPADRAESSADREARAATDIGVHVVETPWFALFFRGIIAGWLVAGMVWLTHAVRESVARVLLVIFVMALIPANELFHCIIATSEAFYLVFEGSVGLLGALFGVTVPITLGNTVGGVGARCAVELRTHPA